MDPTVFGTATKNLARKLNTQVSKVRETREVPADDLADQDIFLKFRSHVGFPDGIDSLAYDPRQKLLAVSGCFQLGRFDCSMIGIVRLKGVSFLVGLSHESLT